MSRRTLEEIRNSSLPPTYSEVSDNSMGKPRQEATHLTALTETEVQSSVMKMLPNMTLENNASLGLRVLAEKIKNRAEEEISHADLIAIIDEYRNSEPDQWEPYTDMQMLRILSQPLKYFEEIALSDQDSLESTN